MRSLAVTALSVITQLFALAGCAPQETAPKIDFARAPGIPLMQLVQYDSKSNYWFRYIATDCQARRKLESDGWQFQSNLGYGTDRSVGRVSLKVYSFLQSDPVYNHFYTMNETEGLSQNLQEDTGLDPIWIYRQNTPNTAIMHRLGKGYDHVYPTNMTDYAAALQAGFQDQGVMGSVGISSGDPCS